MHFFFAVSKPKGNQMEKKFNYDSKPTPINDLKELVEKNAADYGDKPLYMYKSGKDVLSFSFNQMKETVDALGTAFAEMGLMGKSIAVIGEASPFYMAAYFAAANGGGAAVPLDKELDPATIASFMEIAGAELIVYTESMNKKMPEIASHAANARFFVPIVPNEAYMPDDRFTPLSLFLDRGKAALASGNRKFIDHTPDREAPAAMIFTSGTTGTSKCVLLSQKNLAANCNACVDATHFCPDNTFVSVLPMNHSYEVTTEHLALARYGATTYLNDSLKNALKSFNYFKPDSLLLVPLFVETVHKRIWHQIDKKGKRKTVNAAIKLSNALRKIGIDLRRKLFAEILESMGGNLKMIICGGAPLSKQLIKDFDAFGIDIYEGYGITECSPLVAVNRYKKKRLGSVGPAVNCCEVKIDKTSPDDKTGEILVKGDNVMIGYLNNPEANAEVFTEDGWFRTGDIGYLDKDGYIYITGRKKNVIILSNGKNIFPEEIEEHLSHSDTVAESVVIGRPNANGETVITAVVYPNPELTEGKTAEEIDAMVKEAIDLTNKSLPTFKHISAYEVRDTEFEKTTTKKIKRFLVK